MTEVFGGGGGVGGLLNWNSKNKLDGLLLV